MGAGAPQRGLVLPNAVVFTDPVSLPDGPLREPRHGLVAIRKGISDVDFRLAQLRSVETGSQQGRTDFLEARLAFTVLAVWGQLTYSRRCAQDVPGIISPVLRI